MEFPSFITVKWWQRPFHKHERMYGGIVDWRHIERCRCGYGRVDGGRWFKF